MSSVLGDRAEAAPTEAAGRLATPSGRWRRGRVGLLIGGGTLAAVVVLTLSGRQGETQVPLDPDNPSGDGAQAVARVLADEGVDVEVVRSAADLSGTGVATGDTVVVTQTDLLGDSTIDQLLDEVGSARLVVVEAGPGAVAAFGVDDDAVRVGLGKGRDADCDDPLLDGLRIEADTGWAYDDGDCFAGENGAVVSHPRDGLVLLGAGDVLTNDQVLRADNAAVALRLLGQSDRLVWYVPSLQDLTGDDGVSLRSLLPRWIVPGLWLLGVVVVVMALWRGRRLGPLAVEPLPVVVRAVETTRSRGRLYRKAGDRGHAADALRRATSRRCADRLGLGVRMPADAVVQAVAGTTGRSLEAVGALLLPGPAPATDTDLIHLAEDLATLEREVGRP